MAKVCVYADSVLCVGQVKIFREQQKDGKAKLEVSRGIHRTKTQWGSTENWLNSSGEISQDFRHYLSSRDPERLGDKEH